MSVATAGLTGRQARAAAVFHVAVAQMASAQTMVTARWENRVSGDPRDVVPGALIVVGDDAGWFHAMVTHVGEDGLVILVRRDRPCPTALMRAW